MYISQSFGVGLGLGTGIFHTMDGIWKSILASDASFDLSQPHELVQNTALSQSQFSHLYNGLYGTVMSIK